jgi:hypothetical protein
LADACDPQQGRLLVEDGVGRKIEDVIPLRLFSTKAGDAQCSPIGDGVGYVQVLAGDRRYYTFPERTAVVNAFMNGNRAFLDSLPGASQDVYRSARFRERPFVQTRWELVLDQTNEAVNGDIPLDGLDDIVLYLYYTDYTP